jgi:hypothetical protein
MRIKNSTIFVLSLLTLLSCRQYIDEREVTNYEYYNVQGSDTIPEPIILARTDEEYLQYGARVAYVKVNGDTIIPFGKYAYYGTDSLEHYANVLEHPNDSSWGRQIAINRNQKILFDLVIFDNGPDLFNEEVTRVLRNGKMGYANKFGQVVIPCIYDYAKWFENGKAEVTFNVKEYLDLDEHSRVESDEWFEINKKGQRIN